MRNQKLGCVFGLVVALVLDSRFVLASANTPIEVLNPEDLAPFEGGKWVFSSSMLGALQKQGAIYAIDSGDGKARQVYPSGDAGKSSTPQCLAPVAAAAFAQKARRVRS